MGGSLSNKYDNAKPFGNNQLRGKTVLGNYNLTPNGF